MAPCRQRKNRDLIILIAGHIMLTFLLLCDQAGANALDDTRCLIGIKGEYVNDADIEDSTGEFNITSGTAAFRYSRFTLLYKRDVYSWNHIDDLPFGNYRDDPWKELHSIALGTRFLKGTRGKLSYSVDVCIESSFESEMDDSFGIGTSGTAEYHFQNGWGLGVDVKGVLTHPRAGSFVTLADVNYFINFPEEKITRWFTLTDVQESSPSLIDMRLAFSNDMNLYRLADDSTVYRKGYLFMTEASMSLQVDIKPFDNMVITVAPTYYVSKHFTVYQSNVHEYISFKARGALGGFIKARYSF